MTPTILLADDDPAILTVLSRAMKARGWQVRASDNLSDMDAWITQGLGDVVVTDVTMPRGNGLEALSRWLARRPELPVIVMSAHNTLLNAARAQDLGAVQFLPKPFDLEALLAAIENAMRSDSAASAPRAAEEPEGFVRINDALVMIGKSAAMQRVFATLARLIGNDLTVLITGESGTGKECAARALHALSRRKDKPFVALNMAAIPRELIESALFGHERGAFTGAHQKQVGAFERANGGTLFLDEIGDMPMEAQTRLLRVLQEQQVMPIGAVKPIATDVRIVAATHRNLSALVAKGEFRDDLFFRLHVVPLALPPLRERAEDIPALVHYFMSRASKRGLHPKPLDDRALELLKHQRWVGNVRELEHCLYRLWALDTPALIRASDVESVLLQHDGASTQELLVTKALPAEGGGPASAKAEVRTGSESAMPQNIEAYLLAQFRRYFAAHGQDLPPPGLYDRVLARLERPLIAQTLRATGGNQIKAAEILGINRNTLRKKMRLLGIDTKTLLLSDAA